MKKSTQAIITVLTALAAGSVSAQSMNKSAMEKDSGWYGEVGYLGLNTSSSALNGSQTPKLIRFVAGKDINENLSIEGMAAMTMSKATTNPSTIETAKYSASTYGLYAKPKIEVATGTQLFARIGVAHTSLKLEDTYSGVTGSATSGAKKCPHKTALYAALYPHGVKLRQIKSPILRPPRLTAEVVVNQSHQHDQHRANQCGK